MEGASRDEGDPPQDQHKKQAATVFIGDPNWQQYATFDPTYGKLIAHPYHLSPEGAALLTEYCAAIRRDDRACRQATGHALSPNTRAFNFTLALMDARGIPVDWKAACQQW